MTNELPPPLAAQVREYPEFRMGVQRIGVRLMCGISVDDVMVSGGRVRKVLGRETIPFDAGEVMSVTDQSERPLPPGF